MCIILIVIRKKSSKKEKDIEVVETQDLILETPLESITTPENETTIESVPVLKQHQKENLEE
jgi:hypothetical protein